MKTNSNNMFVFRTLDFLSAAAQKRRLTLAVTAVTTAVVGLSVASDRPAAGEAGCVVVGAGHQSMQ